MLLKEWDENEPLDFNVFGFAEIMNGLHFIDAKGNDYNTAEFTNKISPIVKKYKNLNNLFDECSEFNNGIAIVKLGNVYNYIDINRNFISKIGRAHV